MRIRRPCNQGLTWSSTGDSHRTGAGSEPWLCSKALMTQLSLNDAFHNVPPRPIFAQSVSLVPTCICSVPQPRLSSPQPQSELLLCASTVLLPSGILSPSLSLLRWEATVNSLHRAACLCLCATVALLHCCTVFCDSPLPHSSWHPRLFVSSTGWNTVPYKCLLDFTEDGVRLRMPNRGTFLNCDAYTTDWRGEPVPDLGQL